MQDLVKKLHPLERKVLPSVSNCISLTELKDLVNLQEIEIMRALQWLGNKELIILNNEERDIIDLDLNGKKYLKEGLPEQKFLEAIGNKVLELNQIANESGLSNEELNACIGILKVKNAIEVTKDKKYLLTNYGKGLIGKKSIEQELLERLPLEVSSLKDLEKLAYDNLKKRKNMIKIEKQKEVYAKITDKGKKLKEFDLNEEYLEALTPELLKSRLWERKEFRAYDLQAEVPKVSFGRVHPLTYTVNKIRDTFLKMGFKEMKGPLVETTFWCWDSMWIPQDHPSRDVQDTFYLPYKGKISEKLAKDIAIMHETGGKTGSKGYGYKWNPELAKELILRTHTTATTFRYFSEKKIQPPAKYFYVGRIFRNEAIDATHLPEFHQCEGFIMDEGLTLRDLQGAIKEFYSLMGVHKIKFKPTYNPYTECSMEAIGYFEELGKWVELINSGLFRPESLEPFGIKVPVIAWGLGVERLAMLLHKETNIRNILGVTCDFEKIKSYNIKW